MDIPASPDGPTYRVRSHAFVQSRTYRLTDDALTWEEEGKPIDGVFYEDIAEIRLAYVPTRLESNRYRSPDHLQPGRHGIRVLGLTLAGD